MLKWDLEYLRGIFLVRLNGSLNKNNMIKINNYLIPIIQKLELRMIIINLANLENIDKSGINALLNIECTVKERKGIIYFCELKSNMIKILYQYHIKIVSSEKTALKLVRCNER